MLCNLCAVPLVRIRSHYWLSQVLFTEVHTSNRNSNSIMRSVGTSPISRQRNPTSMPPITELLARKPPISNTSGNYPTSACCIASRNWKFTFWQATSVFQAGWTSHNTTQRFSKIEQKVGKFVIPQSKCIYFHVALNTSLCDRRNDSKTTQT